MELATFENTLFALEPIKRTVPTTITRMTANMTAYSAISCPSSPLHSWRASSMLFLLTMFVGSSAMVFPRARVEDLNPGRGRPLRPYFKLGKISVTRQANHTLQYGRKVVISCIRGDARVTPVGRPDRSKTV